MKFDKHRNIFILVAFYAISRVMIFLLGVRFDASPITWYWQYLDPQLLGGESLLGNLWLLHSQPPLYNFFLGFILNIFGENYTLGFHISYLFIGLILCVSLYFLLREFRVKQWVSMTVALLFSISPSAISYENWLFYTYPICAVLSVVALMGIKLARTHKLSYAVCFLVLTSVLVLSRSLFHPVFYLISVILAVLLTDRAKRKKAIGAGFLIAVPILVILLKNLLLFGFLGTSSWFGLNLAKVSTFMLPDREREAMVNDGTLSEHALVHPFGELWRREEWLAKTEIPIYGSAATDSMYKSTGENNYNHSAYIILSRQYFSDAVSVLSKRPAVFVKAMVHAYGHYFAPSSCYPLVEDNVRKLGVYAGIYEFVFQGSPLMLTRLELALAEDSGNYISVILSLNLLMLTLLPVALIYWSIQVLKRKEDWILIIPVLLIFAFATVAGNTVEVGENNRFRFMIDPLIIVLILVALFRMFAPFHKLCLDKE